MTVVVWGPTTARASSKITREGEVFVRKGNDPVSAADFIACDLQAHVVWVDDGHGPAACQVPMRARREWPAVRERPHRTSTPLA